VGGRKGKRRSERREEVLDRVQAPPRKDIKCGRVRSLEREKRRERVGALD
jgi:hypothetical protein